MTPSYGGLEACFPLPVASGIYCTYVEASPIDQLIVLGVAQSHTLVEIGQAIDRSWKRVQSRFLDVKTRVRLRVPLDHPCVEAHHDLTACSLAPGPLDLAQSLPGSGLA